MGDGCIPDRSGHCQSISGISILDIWPHQSWRIQQNESRLYFDKLLVPGYRRLIPGFGHHSACQAIDQG